MSSPRQPTRPRNAIDQALPRPALATAALWLLAGAVGLGLTSGRERWLLALTTSIGLVANVGLIVWLERRRWVTPLDRLAAKVDALTAAPNAGVEFSGPPALEQLVNSLNSLADECARLAAPVTMPPPGESGFSVMKDSLTRSALFPPPSATFEIPFDSQSSAVFATTDMVNRLEPKLFRWLESSQAEQQFLGWRLSQLREKSFLEIVHPDDMERVREALQTASKKGEIHGVILRIRTAYGKPKAIEMNISTRYGSDMALHHLRCHITDVTQKVRSERELRLRTRELTQVNEQLRLINRELEELKEQYRDLYQNAPAMYFTLDDEGRILECNDTLLRTLGYRREALVGQPYQFLMPEVNRPRFAERFAEFKKVGTVEVAGEWVKASGEVIDVWVSGEAIRSPDGKLIHSRSVAQDVTARHKLEEELREKHERLAQANVELSRRNKEMDEFTYVVSHDLQEPLRTLIAFSDFLSRDYGDRLDAEGQEFVKYIVDASRRMRALILDLLKLSRAGKVADEFATIDLEEIVRVIKADLAELIRTKGGEVRVAGPLPAIWGDRARVGQLLSNLIGNGLKYNESPSPWVEVGTVPDGEPGWETLSVRDNGIGIEPQFHAKIFQLFRRLHTREEYDGTGAGLAICAKIVEAHGGRMWVESEPGNGAAFFIRLPSASGWNPSGADQPSELTHVH